MKQLIVHIRDQEKAETLSKILTALDFRNITPESIRQAAWREEKR